MEAMKWAHLPVAGGMYDQHPDFLEKVQVYMTVRNREERKKQDRENAKHKQNNLSSRPPTASRRRR